MHRLTIATVTMLLTAACVSTAATQAPVTGAPIASEAKATALDHAHAIAIKQRGKATTFTPASAMHGPPASRMRWASLGLGAPHASATLAISVTFTGQPTLIVYASAEEDELQT